jgi:hypothetical protein
MNTEDSGPHIDSGDSGPAQAPAMPFIYCNSAGIRGGAFDMSLEFSYVIPPGLHEAPAPPVSQIRIAMSWEHARALHQLLGEHLELYETHVGKLPAIENLKTGDANDHDG